jgi:hypothetical protein
VLPAAALRERESEAQVVADQHHKASSLLLQYLCEDLVFTQYSNTYFKNTLLCCRVFNLAKNTLEWREFVGISQDYPLKTQTSK